MLQAGVVSTDAGSYENGRWQWFMGAKGFEVPKGRTLIITDAQAWVLHESGTGTTAALELLLEHPTAGYSGSMAIFNFPDLRANASGAQRQVWTSGFAVPGTVSLKLWVPHFHGGFAPLAPSKAVLSMAVTPWGCLAAPPNPRRVARPGP